MIDVDVVLRTMDDVLHALYVLRGRYRHELDVSDDSDAAMQLETTINYQICAIRALRAFLAE